MEGGSESNIEKAVANRVRTTLAIGTPQPRTDLRILTLGQGGRQTGFGCAPEKKPAGRRPNLSYFEALVPGRVRLGLSTSGLLCESKFPSAPVLWYREKELWFV